MNRQNRTNDDRTNDGWMIHDNTQDSDWDGTRYLIPHILSEPVGDLDEVYPHTHKMEINSCKACDNTWDPCEACGGSSDDIDELDSFRL